MIPPIPLYGCGSVTVIVVIFSLAVSVVIIPLAVSVVIFPLTVSVVIFLLEEEHLPSTSEESGVARTS